MIQDPEFNRYYQLFEMGEKKIALKQDLSEFNADSLKKFDSHIDLVNETKIIAGISCKKAVVTLTPRDPSEGEESIFDVFYAPGIGDDNINDGSEFAGIPGMLLQFQSNNSGMIIKFVATEVKPGGVKDTDFLLPSDYKVVAPADLEKEFSNLF